MVRKEDIAPGFGIVEVDPVTGKDKPETFTPFVTSGSVSGRKIIKQFEVAEAKAAEVQRQREQEAKEKVAQAMPTADTRTEALIEKQVEERFGEAGRITKDGILVGFTVSGGRVDLTRPISDFFVLGDELLTKEDTGDFQLGATPTRGEARSPTETFEFPKRETIGGVPQQEVPFPEFRETGGAVFKVSEVGEPVRDDFGELIGFTGFAGPQPTQIGLPSDLPVGGLSVEEAEQTAVILPMGIQPRGFGVGVLGDINKKLGKFIPSTAEFQQQFVSRLSEEEKDIFKGFVQPPTRQEEFLRGVGSGILDPIAERPVSALAPFAIGAGAGFVFKGVSLGAGAVLGAKGVKFVEKGALVGGVGLGGAFVVGEGVMIAAAPTLEMKGEIVGKGIVDITGFAAGFKVGSSLLRPTRFRLGIEQQELQVEELFAKGFITKETAMGLREGVKFQKTIKGFPDVPIIKPLESLIPKGTTIAEKEVFAKTLFDFPAGLKEQRIVFGGKALELRGIRKGQDIDIFARQNRLLVKESAAILKEVSAQRVIVRKESFGLSGEKAFDIKSFVKREEFLLTQKPIGIFEGFGVIKTQEQISRALSKTLALRKGGRGFEDVVLGGRKVIEQKLKQPSGLPLKRGFEQFKIRKAELQLIKFEQVLPEINILLGRVGEKRVLPFPVRKGRVARPPTFEDFFPEGKKGAFRGPPRQPKDISANIERAFGKPPKPSKVTRDLDFVLDISEIKPSRIKPPKRRVTPSIFGLPPPSFKPSKFGGGVRPPKKITPSFFETPKPSGFFPSLIPSGFKFPPITTTTPPPPPPPPPTELFPPTPTKKKPPFFRFDIPSAKKPKKVRRVKRKFQRTISLGTALRRDFGLPKELRVSQALEESGLAERRGIPRKRKFVKPLGPFPTKPKTKKKVKKKK